MARGTRKNTGTEHTKEKGTKIYSNGLHDAASEESNESSD